jgi:hypothetical protein
MSGRRARYRERDRKTQSSLEESRDPPTATSSRFQYFANK